MLVCRPTSALISAKPAPSGKRRFEYQEGSSSKFWEIVVNGSAFTTTGGKIGASSSSSKTKDCASPAAAQTNSVTVNFNTNQGTPQQLASGTLYGITQNGSNPPDQFLTQIGWNSLRAGGSQLNNPGGWAFNEATYVTRWNSTLAQYQRASAHGASFVAVSWSRRGVRNAPSFAITGTWTRLRTR